MDARRKFGFRSDKAYVRKLIRRGMWESDFGFIPVTPAEDRYLQLRDRLELGPRVDRYLRRHPRLSGGVSVEDDWPREPYLLVRVTRDADRYERLLRRLARFPRNLRTKRVARSERSLRRIQDRIDFRAHEPDGFHVSSVGVAIDRNRVLIRLITRRTDAEAYFRAHYGPSVTTDVIATELTRPACAGLFGYRPAPDGRASRSATRPAAAHSSITSSSSSTRIASRSRSSCRSTTARSPRTPGAPRRPSRCPLRSARALSWTP